jgi:hypothetical protein
MDAASPDPKALRSTLVADGDPSVRRVGVEIEFLGLSARDAAEALARGLGGTAEAEDPHAYWVRGTRLGDLTVEIDLRHAHPQRHRRLAMIQLGSKTAAWLGGVVAPIVPRELIVAPVAVSRLSAVDEAVAILRAAGARGRGVVLLESISLHFNVEPPRMDAATITTFLKSFLVLDPHLRHDVAQGGLRRTLALPPRFPEAYRRRVLDPDYWPDLLSLMSDYLAANPSRKRGLDLLPLFAHLDEDRVRAVLPREKIGPRPVFHYRLPQACLGDAGWSIMPDWERWLAVEGLATDAVALDAKCRAALA